MPLHPACSLGIDLGTTSVSAAVSDLETGVEYISFSSIHSSDIPGAEGRREQDPQRIFDTALSLIGRALSEFPDIRCMGITGQMHGIVYIGASGKTVSPLITWQDERSSELFPGSSDSYCEKASEITGLEQPFRPGYGLSSHFYNTLNGLVPEEAVTFCTIMDAFVLYLTDTLSPLVHTTDAASFGLYDPEKEHFNETAAEALGIDPAFLPGITGELTFTGTFSPERFGITSSGSASVPVLIAAGDNQCSFRGSVSHESGAVLLNFGTGSQISFLGDSCPPGLEKRPYFNRRTLLCGSALCGGRAYALLERFFREYASLLGADGSQYDLLNRLASESTYDSLPVLNVQTTFAGTRNDPSLRGAITDIGEENFHPASLVRGVLRGMAEELRGMAADSLPTDAELVASGNAARRNPALCRALEEVFRMPLHLSVVSEEAAYGASLLASSALIR